MITKRPRTIPAIIKMINESSDMNAIEEMENYIGCYYGIPVLLIGSIANFILHYENKSSVYDSAFMLFLCLCFLITPYMKIKTRIITHWISILFSVVLIFVTVRVYDFLGPSIWTIAFLNVIISSIRMTKIMLNYVTASVMFVGMYYSLVLSKHPFEYGTIYYIIQVILIALVIVIAPVVHLINQAHYHRINNMYMTEVKQREELEQIYQNIAATHAELSSRYYELNEKNTELKKNEEKLYYLAHYDGVTELPNRKSIVDKICDLIYRFKEEELKFYTVFIDIDSFKKINDTMGHHIGDLFIKEAADRFRKHIHIKDTIGRIGGDEFALIIERKIDRDEVYADLEKIRREFLNPFYIGNNEIKTSASFGVAVFPFDGQEQIELMRNADTAMYKAKELGKNNVQFFEASMKYELTEDSGMLY